MAYAKLILLFIGNYGSIINLLLTVLVALVIVCAVVGITFVRRLKNIADEKLAKDRENFDISQQFNSLINSLNDIIFEFDEDKVCRNVWFNDGPDRVIDPKSVLNKRLEAVLGPEKAKKFNDAIDYVIKNRKSTSIEYISDFGTGEWFIARFTPVCNRDGSYTSRISASLTNITGQKKYEQALKENEVLLLEAQSIAKTGNWWYDHNTSSTYWSDTLFAILEIDVINENIGKLDYYIHLVHPDDRETARQYFLNIHKKNSPSQSEHRLITPNGRLKYIKVWKGSESPAHSKRLSGVVQDITESKLTERALKLSRTELIEAQAIAKIGNWKWNISGKTIDWSDEIATIFELDEKKASAREALQLLLTYTDKRDRAVLHNLLKSVLNVRNYSFVFRIITPGGKTHYLSAIVGKLLKREDGSIRKVIGTLQDITERREAEIAYQETENKYKLVLETVKLVALSLDRTGAVTFCNHYLADLLGYKQDEILGRQWLDFVPESTRTVITDWYVNNVIAAKNVNPVICRNGEERIISWQNTVTYDEYGQIKESTSIGEDITDQQKATQELITAKEMAERSSEFKSEFLSIMSHEIRTPMNAVIGTTNLLLSEDPKPEQLDYLNILKFSAENLLAIINDILDYNKIEAGKLELNVTRFNIHQLVSKIRKSFEPKANEKILDMELSIDKSIPEFVMGDQIRLSQILNNLVGNAVKFTQKGKVSISLEHTKVKGYTGVKFTVADTGIGIAPKNLRMIFDPFMQESQFINTNSNGTGLGLAITKRLVELHQSDIHVTSELGKGTRFEFTILFGLADKEAEVTSIPGKDGPMLNLYGMNILLVDDNKMNLLIAAKFLKKWQANVDEAFDGQVAVDMVKRKPYDLVIMDLQMPVMDGFKATEHIKQTHPDMPVIALTADAMPETQVKAAEAGMVDYLTKPFVPGILFEKVSKFYKVTPDL